MPYRWSFRALGILLAFVLTFETACRAWIEKPVQPDTNAGVGRHRLVRVITYDGDTLTMRAVSFTNDSIVGLDSRLERHTGVARTDVKAVEVRMDGTPSWVRLAWKIYLGVLFGLVVAMGVIAAQIEFGK